MRLMCAPDEPLFRWCADTLSEIGKRTVCVKPNEPQEIRQRYLQIMCQLTKGTLSADNIVKLWDEVHGSLEKIVPMEKDLVWQGKDPTTKDIPKSFGAEYVRLREWIPRRIKSVQEQITKLGVACAPGCDNGAKESCTYLGCAGERRCTDNAWTACAPVATCAQPQPKPGQTASPTTPANATDSGGCRFAGGTTPAGGALALLGLLFAALFLRRKR
jgi:uncharacterized protein (TIGR03382 family)